MCCRCPESCKLAEPSPHLQKSKMGVDSLNSFVWDRIEVTKNVFIENSARSSVG